MSCFVTERNSAGIHLLALSYLTMAWTVLYTASNGGVPMPPEAHGDAIHAIPAEAWAVVCIAGSIAVIWALFFRLYAALSVAAALMAAVNGYLTVFAAAATYGFLVSRGAGVFTVLFAALAIGAGMDAARNVIVKYWDRWRE